MWLKFFFRFKDDGATWEGSAPVKQSIRCCQCRPSISFIFLVLTMLSTVVTLGQTSDDGKPDEVRKPAAPRLEVLNGLFSASKVEILKNGQVRLAPVW